MLKHIKTTTPEMITMDQSQIENVLKRLGFFHIQEIDQGPVSEFRAGHVPSAPFVVLSRDKATGALSGPYAELVERLAAVVSRHAAESDDVIMLPSAERQAWISDLARQAQLTTSQLQAVVSSVRA
jgi:hypothetical protein